MKGWDKATKAEKNETGLLWTRVRNGEEQGIFEEAVTVRGCRFASMRRSVCDDFKAPWHDKLRHSGVREASRRFND